MEGNIIFRDLRADEIECRVQSAKQSGVTLLLYKDARCDMSLLDETVGNARWQRRPEKIDGVLYCHVGIKCGDEWVWKADCGTESNTEAQKGESSDAFKRACVNWGIGRELYTAPFIWVPADKCKIIDGKKCYDDFTVEKIIIENKKIMALSIFNSSMKSENGRPVRAFVWKHPDYKT